MGTWLSRRRGTGQRPGRAYKVVAAGTTVAVTAALAVAAVQVTAVRRPGPPTQQQGTAAGLPHRVPASETIGRLVDGKMVRVAADASGRTRARVVTLPAAQRPKGAVPPAAKPPPLKLGIREPRPPDRMRALRAPQLPPVAGFSPRTSRVLPADTSPDQIVYQNADGTKTAKLYQSPVNYRLPDGSWAAINTSLVLAPTTTAPAGGWRERAAAQPETFAPYADAEPLAVMPLGSGESVGIGVLGVAHLPGSAQGNTVTYANARPGSSVRLAAGAGTFDVQMILRSARAPATWVLPLRLARLTAHTGPGGVIEFTGKGGKVVAFMPPGLMMDSKINPRSGDGAVSTGVSYALTTANGRPVVTVTLDRAWLDSRSRVFPVTVDPSVESFNSDGTTYVQSPNDADYSGDTEIHVGTYDGGTNVARAFMKFSNVSSVLKNDTVLGVRLGLFNSWSYSCSPRTVDVYPVTVSWPVTGNKTYPGPAIGGSVGSKSFATGYVAPGSTTSNCPAQWEGIELNQAGTNLVNGWTHGTTPNDGLALGASSSDSYAWKKFTSVNTTNGAPFLSVTYTTDGARYALASKVPVQQVTPTQAGEIKVDVTNTGSSTWTPSSGYKMSYVAYNSAGKPVATAPVFTSMPGTVGPGGTASVNVKVNALPVGSYAIDFSMYSNAPGSPQSFVSQDIAPLATGLYVPQPPPVVTKVYPPTGYISATVTPQLSTTATSTNGQTITYDFSAECQPLPGTICPGGSLDSGTLSVPYWTPPPMTWDEPYSWTVKVTTNGVSTTTPPALVTPEVPQPVITSGLGGADGQAFDPQSGNFTTSATDAAEAVPGRSLRIQRTYDSLDPRANGAFGAGWSSSLDAAVTPDSDESGNVMVSLPDGQQVRFGYNAATQTYAPPMGSSDALVQDSGGGWTLTDSADNQYQFDSGGQLETITDASGLTQQFTDNAAGEVASITDTASGRSLSLTWSTPAGATYAHVSSVTTNPVTAGKPGLTWTYSYTDDQLSQVCGPSGDCTSYSYTTGSDYQSAVLDAGPESYWQFGDPAGTTSAADDVDANLGTTNGTYSNVTLGVSGPLSGSSETAASFNGTSSVVALPSGQISGQSYVSVGVWFKAASSTASGVLIGYQKDALSDSSGNSDPHDPALYVGGNGKLYGELWNGSIDPMSSSYSVDDGNWHYAVLTGSGTSQQLWLDGTEIASMSGQIAPDSMTNDTAGAGFWASGWPASYVVEGPTDLNTPIGYFDGSIAQAAIYPHPLGQPAIAQQESLAQGSSAELTQVTLPSGRVYQQASYDATEDRVASYTDPNGGQWQIGTPIATGYKSSATSLGEVTRYVTVTSPAGYAQVYGYDALNGGRLVSYTPGNGDAPQTFGYDAAGFLNQVTDSDGNVVAFTNDIHGNVLSRTWYPVGPAVASRQAGPRAPPADSSCTTTGAACTTYYSYYYDDGNPLDPRNDELTGVRDARSASSTDNTYLTSYAYNTAGELTSSTTPATSDFPNGRSTSYTYSTSSTSAFGGGTTPAGLLTSQTTPGGAVTSYEYYSNGDLAQVSSPSGLRTAYTYDGLGRSLTSSVYSDAYPAGLSTSYTYNDLNKPLTVAYPGVLNAVTGVTHTLQDSYSYNADGNLTKQTQSDLTGGNAARTTTYTYNDFGELASVSHPAGDTTGYSYDDSGNVTTMVDGDGNEYDYTYNEYSEVTSVTLTTNSTTLSAPGGGSSLTLDSYGYDPAGLLKSVTDATDRITGYFYDTNDDLIATQIQPPSGDGRQTAYSYDGAGNLIQTDTSSLPVAPAQQTITDYTYDAADRLTTQAIDPVPAGTNDSGYVNRVTSYTYNADNRVTSAQTTGVAGSSTTSYTYNTAGDLTSRSVQNGSTPDTTTWSYDELGQQMSMTSPDGNAAGATPADYTTSYTYDQAGNLATTTGPPIPTQTYSSQTPVTVQPVTTDGYNAFGDQTQVQDPDGNVTATGYDGDSRAISVTQPFYTPPGSSTPITAVSKYAYDGNGNLTSATDPEGNTTSYAYDALGDLTSVTDPQMTGQSAPGVWNYTYDNDGEQLSATSPTGATTKATYDYFGDQATSTQEIATSSGTQYNTTSYTRDYLGDPLTITSPDKVATTNTYDHVGELTSTKDAYGDTSSYDYNYAGQLYYIGPPDGTYQDLSYDPDGNLASVTDYGTAPPPQIPPTLATWTYGYDPSGNLTSATDPDNNTTTYDYNAADELTSATAPLTSSTSATNSYGYDPAGNQTSVTGGRGNTTWTTYNPWNLAESVIKPATAAAPNAADRTWTTSYTPDGQPSTVTQPGGITQTYGYDQIGDRTSESGSGAAAATTPQSFGYNTSGQLTTASAPGGTDTFSYDGAGNLTSANEPSGNVTFGYNPDDLMTSRADAAGTTTYTYDNADRLATASDPLTGATVSYGYNADSQPTSIGYSINGAAGPSQSFGYNGLRQLTGSTLTAASGGATIASASYGYNADGDLTSQSTSGYAGAASTTYGYNDANELTSATTGGTTTSYSYNADGDLNQAGATSYTYNTQNQPVSATTSAGTTSYGYTLSGALSSITPPSGSAQDYTSNAFGQMATAPGSVSYGYDALGRLATRTTSSGTSTFAYSGLGGTLASDGTTSYSYDPAGNPIAAQTTGSPADATLSDVHTDLTGLFRPTATASKLAASAAYSPYGQVTATTGTMPALGYQGQYTDPATSDTDMASRWYAPATRTFTSNDTLTGSPISSTIDGTPYGYADGNPLTSTDSTGQFCWNWSCLAHDVGGWSCALDAVCAALSWLNATPTASGCGVDVICGPQGYYVDYAGLPHRAAPYIPTGSNSGDSGGGGGCGWTCWAGGAGVALCLYQPELCMLPPIPPPPPPPPPQDCYAGPNPTCTPPPPPPGLRQTPHITDPAHNTTNPNAIPRADTIIQSGLSEDELLQELHQQLDGATFEPGQNGNTSPAASTTNPADQPLTSTGEPGTPQPDTPGTSPADSGNAGSGGPPAPPSPPAPEPPDPEPGNARFIASSNGTITDTNPAEDGVTSLKPTEVRLSQSSVNGAAKIIDSMRVNGWVGDPIDVVQMPDGDLTTVDNTRVVAANQAEIDIQAMIHGFDDPLPEDFIDRFTTPKGGVPSTWGDGVLNRIGAQNSLYRNTYPFGSPFTGWAGN